MSTPTVKKPIKPRTQKPAAAPEVLDIDALLSEASGPAVKTVALRFRGQEWTFKGIADAPIGLFDSDLDEATAALHFLQTMVVGDPLPVDVTLREATTIVNAYTHRAAGLSAGE